MTNQIEKKSKLILKDEPIWKGIVTLALPVFLANIFKTLHDLVDAFFIGQIGDATMASEMQGAIGLTWPIFFVFISFGMGLSVAGNALVGQYLGKGDILNAKKYATNVTYLSIGLGVLFTALAYFLGPQILKWMGVEGNMLTYGTTYVRVRAFELTALFLTFAFQAIRRATGDTVTPVIVSTLAILLNIGLTPLLVLHFNMGILGAALATLIANWVVIPVTIFLLIKNKNGISIKFKISHINKDIIKHIGKIAIPASSGQAIQAVGFIILQAFIKDFGYSATAAFYLGNRINSLVMFPVSSISNIIAVFVAQNIGAGNIIRARQAIRQGTIMSVVVMIIGVSFILPFREQLVRVFSDDLLVIDKAIEYMFYIAIALPFVAVFQIFLSTFQGSGDTKFAFWLAIIRLWFLRLPLVRLSMEFTDLGPTGIWISMLVSNVVAVIVGGLLYSKIDFKPKIKIEATT